MIDFPTTNLVTSMLPQFQDRKRATVGTGEAGKALNNLMQLWGCHWFKQVMPETTKVSFQPFVRWLVTVSISSWNTFWNKATATGHLRMHEQAHLHTTVLWAQTYQPQHGTCFLIYSSVQRKGMRRTQTWVAHKRCCWQNQGCSS